MKAILTYHSIDTSGSIISVDPSALRRHLAWLRDSSVRVVGIRELLALPAEEDAAAITFDDGFENFATEAWPLLREHGYPATIYVVTGHVGGTNDWDSAGHRGLPRLPLLDWAGLAELARRGVTVASHGESHRDLRSVAPAELERELRDPVARIAAETGTQPEDFAYPYGAHDRRVMAAVGAYYATAVTTDLGPLEASPDPLRLPRIDMYYLRKPGPLQAWGSGRLRRTLLMRNRLRRVRGMLRK
jgi:peptidoglycan/xylan/chitin deacetylase (PgdA/CDA1 family)